MPFKSNLVKATLIRPAFGSTLAVLVYAWVILPIAPLLIIKFALAIIWIIGFDWVWALQPRFENSPGRTMLNSCIFVVSNPDRSLALVGMDLVYLALVTASWIYLPQGLSSSWSFWGTGSRSCFIPGFRGCICPLCRKHPGFRQFLA